MLSPRTTLTVGTLLSLLVPALPTAQAPALRARHRARPVAARPSEYVVALAPGHDLRELEREAGVRAVDGIPGTNLYLVQSALPGGEGGTISMKTRLGSSSAGLFAEPNMPVHAPELLGCSMIGGVVGGQNCTVAFVDSDPTAPEYFNQPAMPAINASAAQAFLTGRTTVVAVIDTGIDPTHPILQGKVFAPGHDYLRGTMGGVDLPNGLDDDGDGVVDEAYGHGTHISGTITLINPDARILPLRVLDSDGNGRAFDVAAAIYESIAQGAEVINLSLSMLGQSLAVSRALDAAADQNIDILSSAGNTGRRLILFPASHDDVISVGSVDVNDIKSPFSAFGAELTLCAPGVDIYSAMPGNRYATWSGTSMACGVASGVASLLRSIGAGSAASIEEPLEENCTSIDPLNPPYVGFLGEGRIDAEASALDLLGQ